MIEYVWRISGLKSIPNRGDLNNILNQVYWRLQAKDGTKFAEVTGITDLSDDIADPSTFLDYSELNKDIIIGWVQDVLGETKIAQMKLQLQNQLK